jgi:membrane protein implicated in regulation of membrane protease activity
MEGAGMLMNLPAQTAIWIGLAVLFGIFEIFTTGFFFVFFAFGALVAALVSLWLASPLWTTLVFVAASLLFVFFARPILKKTLQVGDQPRHASNVNALIGVDVLVLEPVDRLQGRVKVVSTGEIWSAYLRDADRVLPIDSFATVEGVDGAKLVIKPKI